MVLVTCTINSRITLPPPRPTRRRSSSAPTVSWRMTTSPVRCENRGNSMLLSRKLKAITLVPNDAPAQNALGLALWSRNPVDPDALTAYRAAIALDPELPDPYRNLATALED